MINDENKDNLYCAKKIIFEPEDEEDFEKEVKKIVDEITILRLLKHKNIIGLFDYFFVKGEI